MTPAPGSGTFCVTPAQNFRILRHLQPRLSASALRSAAVDGFATTKAHRRRGRQPAVASIASIASVASVASGIRTGDGWAAARVDATPPVAAIAVCRAGQHEHVGLRGAGAFVLRGCRQGPGQARAADAVGRDRVFREGDGRARDFRRAGLHLHAGRRLIAGACPEHQEERDAWPRTGPTRAGSDRRRRDFHWRELDGPRIMGVWEVKFRFGPHRVGYGRWIRSSDRAREPRPNAGIQPAHSSCQSSGPSRIGSSIRCSNQLSPWLRASTCPCARWPSCCG